MAGSRKARKREKEKAYPKKDSIAKLRRPADALERDRPFRLQVAGTRIAVPKQAIINIEHERGAGAWRCSRSRVMGSHAAGSWVE